MNCKKSAGFSLLEIILVLAIISMVAGVILPNLHLTVDSQMSVSIKNLTSQIRATYDNAIFTGRMHRLIINFKTNEFWVEQAPTNFQGRPNLIDETSNQLLEENTKKNYIEMLNEKSKNLSKRQIQLSNPDNPTYYSVRSIPVIKKDILSPITWNEVNDSLISKHSFVGNVTFVKFMSGLSSKVYEYNDGIQNNLDENKYGYIYFLPDGSTTPASFQIAIKKSDNSISDVDPKYTLNVNTLTGQTNLLEGFQDANFILPKK